MCVCVCVCEREIDRQTERERERQSRGMSLVEPLTLYLLHHCYLSISQVVPNLRIRTVSQDSQRKDMKVSEDRLTI